MKKYFYTNGIEKFGPFSIEELKKENITRETKVWFYGLENWTSLSDVEELKAIKIAIPPTLKEKSLKKTEKNNKSNIEDYYPIPKQQNSQGKSKYKKGVPIIILLTVVFIIGYYFIKGYKNNVLYQKIVDSSYDTSEDFQFYIDKFYRDIGVYGLYPKKPSKKIIKFAKLDQIAQATHYHGISFGSYDDDLIEIYINPSTWKEFNKPMRYYLIYHELAHDVLNLDDLQASTDNEGKLMYPLLLSYENKTMDDFIENSHALFEEISTDF